MRDEQYLCPTELYVDKTDADRVFVITTERKKKSIKRSHSTNLQVSLKNCREG